MQKRRAPEGAEESRRRVVDGWRAMRGDSVGDAVLDDDRMTPDMQRLVQELQLRQIELENQNQELKRARIEVEEGVSRYTQLQVQLAESHKLEAIGTLAGGIAHDFNNILTGLLGELSVLDLKLAQDDASRIYVEDALELVNRGADLTKQLLAFACHAKSDVTPLDLARVVSKTSAMFGRTRKEIEIQLDFPAGLMAVLIDRTQLEQVLLNLFINAAQAMPRGGRLLLRARNAELAEGEVAPFGIPPGLFVKFSITDTGVGMDTATLARIFEPFFTTKGPGLGSGLGLASVHGIIKSHAGFITVESEIGKGTTFSVFLAGTDQSVAEEKTPGAAIVHGSGTILVVDDEQHVLKALTRLLETIGYDALTASSGREAVEIVRRQGLGISLVILDMIMPEMSGGQTYDALRKIAPGIKVLLASGYRLDVQAEALLVQGCAGFIQKPFDLATLSAELQKIQSSSKRRGDVLS